MRNRRSVFRVALLGGVICCGCGGDQQIDVYPTSGTVLIEGKPQADVELAFYPIDQALAQQSILPRAVTDARGGFVLSTYEADDGIPAGEYVLTASWRPAESTDPEEMHPDIRSNLEERLDERYTDPEQSPLQVTIQVSNNQLGPFELTLGKANKKRRK